MNPTEIQQICASAFGTTFEAVKGRSRVRNVADARKMAMALIREQGYSFARIGRMFDHEHATVMYACNVHDTLAATDADYSATFRKVLQTIKDKRAEPCRLYSDKIILQPCRA